MSKEMTKEAGPATPKSDDYELRHQARSLMYSPDEAYQELMASHRTLERELLAAEERIKTLQEAKRPWTPEHTKSVIDGQVKEIDRLTGAVQAERAAKEQAERRAAELEADARRYRWLRDEAVNIDTDGPGVYQSTWSGEPVGAMLEAHTLDQAIDAALSASKGGGVGE